jgi:hypothetical protein
MYRICKFIYLFIESPPAFINLPLNLTLVEGADARFPCEVSGAPKPVIIWQKSKFNLF